MSFPLHVNKYLPRLGRLKCSSLPLAYVVRQEVMFSQVCVCLGGYLPSSQQGGTYLPANGGGGGTYLPANGGRVPTFQPTGGGTYLGWVPLSQGRYPPPQPRWVPPPTRVGTPQPGGRYASCVHAGGLSCSMNIRELMCSITNLHLAKEDIRS